MLLIQKVQKCLKNQFSRSFLGPFLLELKKKVQLCKTYNQLLLYTEHTTNRERNSQKRVTKKRVVDRYRPFIYLVYNYRPLLSIINFLNFV